MLALFPRLADRLGHCGSQFSGGEQQMLAAVCALTTNPKPLILEEATQGLADAPTQKTTLTAGPG